MGMSSTFSVTLVPVKGHWASQVALVVKNSPTSAGDPGDVTLIPGLGKSPGKGNGTPLQNSCLENFMDRGAWLAAVHGAEKSQLRLSTKGYYF